MHSILASLGNIFDQYPEPVFFMEGSAIGYENAAGRALHGTESPLPIPPDLLQTGSLQRQRVTWENHAFWVDVTPLEGGHLLILRSQNDAQNREQEAMGRLAEQLRSRLATLTATTESLASALKKNCDYDEFQRPLAVQLQSICQLLHLARQMELLHHDWPVEYPKHPLDLGLLCAQLTREAADLADSCEVSFLYDCKEDLVPVFGSELLLSRMLLALIANSVRAAGPNGRAGLRLTVRRDQAQIAVWDSGPGIPPQQLERLFQLSNAQGLPNPGEGAQLGLYLAREIALYHGGALLSSNRHKTGAELLISLPLYQDGAISLRSPNMAAPAESFSPTLIALSDALPWQVFAQLLNE